MNKFDLLTKNGWAMAGNLSQEQAFELMEKSFEPGSDCRLQYWDGGKWNDIENEAIPGVTLSELLKGK